MDTEPPKATKGNHAQFGAISALKLERGEGQKWSVQPEVWVASANGRNREEKRF